MEIHVYKAANARWRFSFLDDSGQAMYTSALSYRTEKCARDVVRPFLKMHNTADLRAENQRTGSDLWASALGELV